MVTNEHELSEDSHEQKPQRTREKLSRAEIKSILDRHTEWLANGCKGQGRADFSNKDLAGQTIEWEGRNISHANFQDADISGCVFKSAKLEHCSFDGVEAYNAKFHVGSGRGSLRFSTFRPTESQSVNLRLSEFIIDCHKVDFTGANLIRAQFTGKSGLEGAVFHEANLQDANLVDTLGLTSDALAGADLACASLPDYLKSFKGLTQSEQMVTQAKRLFSAVILACLFSWFMILTTTDASLLTNSSQTQLPFINVQIPIVGFYWVAPIALLCLFEQSIIKGHCERSIAVLNEL